MKRSFPARPRRFLNALSLTLFLWPITPSQAADPEAPVITKFDHNGRLEWTDEVEAPAGYRIEWAPSADGPWSESWAELSLIVPSPTNGSVEGVAAVPMFYRVVRIDSYANLPDPVTNADFMNHGTIDEAMVSLGQELFFDKILSGNLDISCASCHHPFAATGDGLSLPIGEGGRGVGVTRDTGSGDDAVVERVPRNAPPIFNLGAKEFVRMFHDGRVEVDPNHPSGFQSPAGDDLPPGMSSALAVQAMFPVTSATEMAGQAGENPIAELAVTGNLPGVWEALAQRLREISGYADQFIAVFPNVQTPADITYAHAAEAIAAFEAFAWRADNSPFDAYLRGDRSALGGAAQRGMNLFYGAANCYTCHSGKFQTDHDFHAIAMPQLGGGKGDGTDGREDFGRERVTQNVEDRYRFRTPPLRNVALTGPWGHSGAFNSLEGVVRHHLNPLQSIQNFDETQVVLPSREDLDAIDFVICSNPERSAPIRDANELEPVELTDSEVADLIAFLDSLTDLKSTDLRRDVPKSVPSGLSLAE